MAVIDAVPGLEVSVCINGQPVNEYEDSGEEIDGPLASKTVVKYIEATSDAEFTINVTIDPAFDAHRGTRDDLLVDAKIDGKWVAGRYRDCTANNERTNWTTVLDGIRDYEADRQTIRAFKFTTVEIVEIADKAKIEEDVKAAANLGEITVEVFRVNLLEYTHPKRAGVNNITPEISEKAIKGRALSHGTTFGAEKTARPQKTRSCSYPDGNDKPLARFIFRYRSKEALRMLLIIPRSPSPDPFEALPAVERERLAREAFLRQQDPKPEPGIKPERIVKRERRDSDVVDLTGDAPTAKQRKTTMEAPIDLTDD
ncbi:hypothetical protein V494_06311 [Pseudogymnoascus sp. VKM F-4513 (FW-928)]|nr:hypothetical protein V494_06311 [Pseudogymnoascus sp. VKM F-4513 (FW-928)]